MIYETEFNNICEKSSFFTYSDFKHMDYCDCTNSDILRDSESLILLIDRSKAPSHIYWAANEPELVIQELINIEEEVYVDLVPKDFVDSFKDAGFSIYAEFVDFFNNELEKTKTCLTDYKDIRFLYTDEISTISAMTKLCIGQTRGFYEEKTEWYHDWLKENDIIIISEGTDLVGYCCVSIYASGTIVWIRRLAVNPIYQHKGYGRRLLEQAIIYGTIKGAKRGFLHADILNKNAISLYNKYDFFAQSDHGEINMIRK